MSTVPPEGTPGDRGQRGAVRDNGLAAEHFVALRDVDPRMVSSLLTVLRRAGIAAYAAPSEGDHDSYFGQRLPRRPADRVWVDSARRVEADALVEGELAVADAEDPFEALVAAFNAPSPADGEVPWPEAEEIGGGDTAAAGPMARVVRAPQPVEPDDALPTWVDETLDDHFVPAPPPPLPRPPIVTFWALVGLIGGLALLITSSALGWQLDALLRTVALVGTLGGFTTLVWRMRDRDGDDDPDDGAVV